MACSQKYCLVSKLAQRCSLISKSLVARKNQKDQQHPTHSCHVQVVTETVEALLVQVAHRAVQALVEPVLLVQLVADPVVAISQDNKRTERLEDERTERQS
jgi:hypothetical protein